MGNLPNFHDALLSQAAGSAGALSGPSTAAFLEGLQNGFVPNVVNQFLEAMRPGADLMIQRGSEDILGAAADAGVLDSTGTVAQIARLSEGINANLLGQAGQLQGQAGLQGQGIQASLANVGQNASLNAAQGFTNPIGQGLQAGQFSTLLPLNAVSTITGGAGQIPLFQPAFGPSPAASILPAVGTIAGAAFGGPGGAAIGGAAGSAAGSIFSK